MSNLTDNNMGHLLYPPPKQYLMPCQSQQQARQKSCLIADWTTTGEQRQLLMILTITVQCRSKGTIAPSVSKNCMETIVHSAKQKSGYLFRHLENYAIQRQMNNQGSMQNKLKDKYLESKTV
jgi:hypothetical protein